MSLYVNSNFTLLRTSKYLSDMGPDGFGGEMGQIPWSKPQTKNFHFYWPKDLKFIQRAEANCSG